jgi:ribose transport system permease protein
MSNTVQTQTQSPVPQPKSGRGQGIGKQAMTILGPFTGLALVILLFSIPVSIRSTFLSLSNFQLVASQTVIVGLGALGMTMIIISAGIDLSVGSVIALTGVLAATWLQAGANPVVAVVGALALGALVGAINGALITSLRVTPFIVTLGTLGIARGITEWIANDTAVYVTKQSWIDHLTDAMSQNSFFMSVNERFGQSHSIIGKSIFGLSTILGGTSEAVWLTIVLAIVVHIVLKHTVFGRSIFAIGSNETASRLSGLRVDLIKIATYALSGVFIGLAGVVQFSKLNGEGDPTVATGTELDVIAAVVIGGGSLNGGEGSILGSLLGALIMTLLRNGSQLMGWPSYTQEITIGAVIIAAVALDRLRHRRSSRV